MNEPKLKVLELDSPRDNYAWCGAVPLAEWLIDASEFPAEPYQKLEDFVAAFAAYASHVTQYGTHTEPTTLCNGVWVFYDYVTDGTAFLFKESNNGQTYIVSHGYSRSEVSPA